MDGESKEARQARHEALWRQLDPKRKGSLDLPALKSGLAQMNHREFFHPIPTSNTYALLTPTSRPPITTTRTSERSQG